MKISKLTIHNWRSIKEVSIDFEDLMIFIGQNNHGKSNILSAILFFFGEIKLNPLDFHIHESELFVEIIFDHLNAQESQFFHKYLRQDQSICVRKSADNQGNITYRARLEIPQAAWLQEENISYYAKREHCRGLPIYTYLPLTGRITKDIYQEAIQEFIADHSTKWQDHLDHKPFLGSDRKAEQAFGEVYFIPAVKDTSDELNPKENSIFGKMLAKIIHRISHENEKYRLVQRKMAELAALLNRTNGQGESNPNRPAEMNELERILQESLQNWQTRVDIEVNPPEVDKVFKWGTSVWIDDGMRTDISRKGHGLQRSVLFAMLKAHARLKQLESSSSQNTTDSSKAAQSTFIIYEEPELYLHPQAEKELFASLQELSEQTDTQVILTTHSSFFIDLERYTSICIVQKNNLNEGSKVIQCREQLFSEDDAKKKFNLSYWINPDRGELFFAKKIILVEGITEKTVLPFLAKKLQVFRYDYTLIDCGNKDNILTYLVLLNKFKLKYTVVYDKDHQARKKQGQRDQADILSRKIESQINPDLGYSIVLENDIEEELHIQAHTRKAFKALQAINHPQYKLPYQLAQKIRLIYN